MGRGGGGVTLPTLATYLFVSATQKLPVESIAMPMGFLNFAFDPNPSVFPAVDKPTNVLTTPVATVSRRIRLLRSSAIVTSPLGDTTRDMGYLKFAVVAAPSKKVVPPDPAAVVTPPAAEIRRICRKGVRGGHFNDERGEERTSQILTLWLSMSATHTLLLASVVHPAGLLKDDVAPVMPSTAPCVPSPATKYALESLTFTMRRFEVSATMKLSLLSTATPLGVPKLGVPDTDGSDQSTASVSTYHVHANCAERFAVGHAVGG